MMKYNLSQDNDEGLELVGDSMKEVFCSLVGLSSVLLSRSLYHAPVFLFPYHFSHPRARGHPKQTRVRPCDGCIRGTGQGLAPFLECRPKHMASRSKPCDNMQDNPCEQGAAMRYGRGRNLPRVTRWMSCRGRSLPCRSRRRGRSRALVRQILVPPRAL